MTPAKLAEVTGVSADMQRDWRRREYISNLGTQSENGRWLYDWYDAFTIYLMRQMYQGGCELSRAQTFAATVGQDVLLYAIEARYPGKVFPQYRFHRFQIDKRGDPKHGNWIAIRFNKLDQVEIRAIGFVIDCLALANELPVTFGDPIARLNILVENDLSKGNADG
jgi:hypothetical protein